MSAEFVVREDLEAVSREAARRVCDAARMAVERSGHCTIALAGGSTPRRLYQVLAAGEAREALPWPLVSWFWSDERCVPPGDPESNYRMAFDALLVPARVPAERIHRIAGEIRPPGRAAAAYEATLREHVEDGALDVILLGAGHDGHTASLFPGSPALDERDRWVVATEAGSDQATRARITFTYPLLDRAREIVVLATGAAKHAVVEAVMSDRAAAARRYPVARLAPAGRLTWLVDRAAAGTPAG